MINPFICLASGVNVRASSFYMEMICCNTWWYLQRYAPKEKEKNTLHPLYAFENRMINTQCYFAWEEWKWEICFMTLVINIIIFYSIFLQKKKNIFIIFTKLLTHTHTAQEEMELMNLNPFCYPSFHFIRYISFMRVSYDVTISFYFIFGDQ